MTTAVGARWFRPSRGILFMAASAFALSTMTVLVKLASASLPTGQIVFVRSTVMLAVSWAMVRRAGVSPWGHNKRGLMTRGLVGFGALAAFYVSVAHLPVSEATTLRNTIPLFTALLAWWILRERVGWPTAIAIACGIGGVLMIAHPGGAGVDPVGVGVGLGSALLTALAYVGVRQLARTDHASVIVFWYVLVGAPLALPWALAVWVTPSPTECLLLLMIGLTTQIGQVLLTMGLALEGAGRATAVGYIQVAFALLWQWTVFDDVPTTWTIAGAALIIGGTVVTTLGDRVTRGPLSR
ncbi:MAG: EamA/RhaT family transporter [Myxococcales bacterium]|nr:EamA/RhaT family transporter [Myxococcales bacterium]